MDRAWVSRTMAVCTLVTMSLMGCGGNGSPTDGDGGGDDPSISISLAGTSLSVQQGENGSFTVSLTRNGGYDGTVTLTLENAPSGVTAAFSPSTLSSSTASSTGTLTVGGSVAPGSYTLTVRATGSGVTAATASLGLTVTEAPGFVLALNPSSLSIEQGAEASSTVEITRSGGFSGDVALSVSGLPQGITEAFTSAVASGQSGSGPDLVTGNSATLTLTVGSGVTPDDYTLTVTGSAEGLDDQTATLTVTVSEAPQGSFSLALNPTSLSLAQGAGGTSTVNITRDGSFAGEVSLSVTGMPAGVTASANPATAAGATSTLTVSVGGSVAAGTYTLTVTGSGQGVTVLCVVLRRPARSAPGSDHVPCGSCGRSGLPLWVAFQDGSGPWTQVVGVNNTYEFTITSDKGAIAFVTDEGFLTYETGIYYATREELNAIGTSQCTSPDEVTKTVDGSVAGLGLTDQATVTLGGAFTTVLGSGSLNFTIQGVPEGVQDLIASKTALDIGTGTSFLEKLIFRRGLNPADGSILPVLDFDGGEAFDPVTQNLTINNVGTDQAVVNMSYFTSNGASASFFSQLASGGSLTFPAVPGGQQEAGDLHLMNVAAAPAVQPIDYSRGALTMFKDAADKTVDLGPLLNAVSVSTEATAPYVRLRTQYTIQSEYDDMWLLAYTQSGGNDVSVFVTAGYQGGGGAFDHTIPDLSGAGGWNNLWGMDSGLETEWILSASGWSGSGGIISPPFLEGEIMLSSSRMGTITP